MASAVRKLPPTCSIMVSMKFFTSRVESLIISKKISPDHSKWDGECFIFDHRVSVVHGLKDGESKLCFWLPLASFAAGFRFPNYEEGVSCPKCYDSLTESKGKAYAKDKDRLSVLMPKIFPTLGKKCLKLTKLGGSLASATKVV